MRRKIRFGVNYARTVQFQGHMNNYSHHDSFVYEGKDLESMSFAQNYHNWIYENIEMKLGNKIAEIGSGVGNFTEFLLRNDHARIDAYEPCAKMHLKNKFSKNPRVKCINSNFESVSKGCDNKYDSVIFINVKFSGNYFTKQKNA